MCLQRPLQTCTNEVYFIQKTRKIGEVLTSQMQRVELRSGAPQLVPKAKCQVFGKVHFLDCEQLFY